MHNSTQYETACTDCMLVVHARQGPDMSGDSEKIFHRSLDLLQFWITDCRQVDFTPKSSLVDKLENFIDTEVTTFCSALYSDDLSVKWLYCDIQCFFFSPPQVIPVDSRGEALLSALHSPPCTTWSQGRASLISFEEDDDPVCVHSSTEDLGRKVSIIRWQVMLCFVWIL